MTQRTVLFDKHLEANGKIVDFAGWEMPINYGSQIEEHHQVRNDAGMFDVSHMVVLDLEGARVREFLQHLLANDVAKLTSPGKALYSCMLNKQGGVIDDLITYFIRDDFFRMVVNAATRDKDLAWISEHAKPFGVSVTERSELAMIAVQGPNARDKAMSILPDDDAKAAAELAPFFGQFIGSCFIARTGYTGEDGFEIMVPNDQAPGFWDKLKAAGIQPCGLGARDTLRLEAGMNLYGSDMDETTSPLESGLGWTIALTPENRDFIGRSALLARKEEGDLKKIVGLVLEARGILRGHQKVITNSGGEGEITSGTFSPTLQKSIAMARVPADIGDRCHVEIRGKLLPTRVVKMPFVRHGKALV